MVFRSRRLGRVSRCLIVCGVVYCVRFPPPPVLWYLFSRHIEGTGTSDLLDGMGYDVFSSLFLLFCCCGKYYLLAVAGTVAGLFRLVFVAARVGAVVGFSFREQKKFCYVNSKSARKKLVAALFNVPRQALDLLPMYARLVAILDKVHTPTWYIHTCFEINTLSATTGYFIVVVVYARLAWQP